MLQTSTRGLTILTWNVLLPNSVDGWWLYKYYGPGVPAEATTWEARQTLMKERLLASDADVICLQEVSDRSFASDFGFLRDAGYDCAIMAKGRMRPATFWKRDRLELCCSDGSRPSAAPPAPAPAAESSAEPEPLLPNFIDSSFTTKADYEKWGDRLLTTMLRHIADGRDDAPEASNPPAGTAAASPPVFVVNAHLSAGSEARRRLRQVHETLESIRKLLAKVGGGGGGGGAAKAGKAGGGKGGGKGAGGKGAGGKGADGGATSTPGPAIVLCGDFNSQGRSGVRELLVSGEVNASFRESGDPTEPLACQNEVTSKVKKQGFGAFADAAESAYVEAAAGGGTGDAPMTRPPTIIAAELMSLMVHESGEGPSARLIAAVDQMFERLSSDGKVMDAADEERWLLTVNRATTRGSEMRKAKACKEARAAAAAAEAGEGAGAGACVLLREDLQAVYASELAQGKFWGVEHDLRAVNGVGLAASDAEPFTATFDYIYHTTASLKLTALPPPLSTEEYTSLLKPGGEILPNAWFPSDHLPVAAAFEFVA